MRYLFWPLWLLLVVLAVIIMYANSFKSHHGGGLDTDKMVLIGIAVILTGSLVVRYLIKKPQVSVWIVGVPVVFFLLWYVKEEVLKIK